MTSLELIKKLVAKGANLNARTPACEFRTDELELPSVQRPSASPHALRMPS
jgi:hypothetical protein